MIHAIMNSQSRSGPSRRHRTAGREARKGKTMNNSLIERMNKAIKRIGGPLAVLNLPDEVREIITGCDDYETRVKMLEMIADKLGK